MDEIDDIKTRFRNGQSKSEICDLEVALGQRYLVIEFKVKQDNQTIENALQEAVTQTIDRKCGMSHNDMDLMRIALVYVRPKDESQSDRGIFLAHNG